MYKSFIIKHASKLLKRISVARNNFKRAGKENVITLIEGDALEVLKTLEGPYDAEYYPI